MTIEIFQIEGSRQESIVKSFTNAGLRLESLNEQLKENEIAAIIETRNPKERQDILSGKSRISPKSRVEFSNNDGSVVSIDFDIVADAKIRNDPVIIAKYVRKRFIRLVRGVLEKEIKLDMTNSIVLSTDSDKFKTSVLDLARLYDCDPNLLYKKCVDSILKSCIEVIREIDETVVPSRQPQREEVYI